MYNTIDDLGAAKPLDALLLQQASEGGADLAAAARIIMCVYVCIDISI